MKFNNIKQLTLAHILGSKMHWGTWSLLALKLLFLGFYDMISIRMLFQCVFFKSEIKRNNIDNNKKMHFGNSTTIIAVFNNL